MLESIIKFVNLMELYRKKNGAAGEHVLQRSIRTGYHYMLYHTDYISRTSMMVRLSIGFISLQ